jgi:hypothetical protein
VRVAQPSVGLATDPGRQAPAWTPVGFFPQECAVAAEGRRCGG